MKMCERKHFESLSIEVNKVLNVTMIPINTEATLTPTKAQVASGEME
jgi:hypothetical protein